MWFYISDKS